MTPLLRPFFWIVGVAALIAVVATPAVNPSGLWEIPAFSFTAGGLVVVGLYLAARRPENRVGFLMVVGGAAWIADEFGSAYAAASAGRVDHLPAEYFFAWLGWVPGPLLLLAIAALVVVFPTGEPVGNWKWLWRLMAIPLGMVVVGAVMLWGVDIETLVTPPQYDSVAEYALTDTAYILSWLLIIPALVSSFYRYRVGSPQERLQLKWLLVAGAVFVIGFLLLSLTGNDDGEEPLLLSVLIGIAMTGIPVSIGVAVMKYRLYEIDRVISRTVGYVLVVGVLGSVYVVGAVWLPSQLVGEDVPALFVAGSTLAVAALFNPVRKLVVGWVDRRFHRSRYDADRVVEEFGLRLRDQVDVSRLADDLEAVVGQTLQPSVVGIWVRQR